MSSSRSFQRRLWIGASAASVVILVGFSACGPPDPPCSEAPQQPTATSADRFEDDRRSWVVYEDNPGASCADVDLWKGKRLFGTSGDGLLSHYCYYAFPGVPTGPDLAALSMKLPKASLDRRDVTPQQADPFEVWEHDSFVRGISPPTGAQAAPVGGVRVIMADTEASEELVEAFPDLHLGSNHHGALLGALIRDITGTYGLGGVEVEDRLAFPRRREAGVERYPLNRGEFGRLSDVVIAIDEALTSWRLELDDLDADPPARLVLNLSLGFQPLPNCITSPAACPSLADRAVYDALRAFVCHGGAIVAAAGNDTGGEVPAEGLLAPAVWQDEPTPTSADCEALLGPTYVSQLEAAYKDRFPKWPLRLLPSSSDPPLQAHLLDAIGAIDHGQRPIAMTRQRACPRFAALGFNYRGLTDVPVPALTGTSVSSAVVSGLLAAAWAAHPEKNPQDILNELASVNRQHPFDSSGPCGAAADACAVDLIGAPEQPANTQNPVTGAPSSDDSLSPSSAPQCTARITSDEETVVWAASDEVKPPAHCLRGASSPVSISFPQPRDPACVKCTFDISAGTISINPADHLSIAYLITIDQVNGAEEERTYDLGAIPGDTTRRIEAPPGGFTSAVRAWVSGYSTDGVATRSQQILVVE